MAFEMLVMFLDLGVVYIGLFRKGKFIKLYIYDIRTFMCVY